MTLTRVFTLAGCLAALAVSAPAFGQEFTLNAEPAAAFWLDDPQMERFTPGYYVALRPGVTFGEMVTLQASYALLQTPAKGDFTANGTAHSITAGLRVRPLAPLADEDDQLDGLFMDFNLGNIQTGDLSRFGFDTGIGYNFQVAPWFAIGPVVRYGHIVQPDDLRGQNPQDAHLLTAGLNMAFGRPAPKPVVIEVPVQVPAEPLECPPAEECPEPTAVLTGCPDWDKDGVCDDDDRCPTQAGPASMMGCPTDPCTGKALRVLVQFPFDSAALPTPQDGNPQTMDPVLDAVAAAIAQDPTCRVCIVGNASEEGPDGHNNELSRDRAAAVKTYLTARGLAASRLPTIGLGSTCPLVPETTRTLNRRVDFRRLQEGESCTTVCPE